MPYGNGNGGLHPQSEDMRDTLAVANVVRAAFGLPMETTMPTAVTGDPAECLYARLFSDVAPVTVGGEGHMVFADTERGRRAASIIARMTGGELTGASQVQTPAVFARVIAAFDRKEFKDHNEY